MEKNISYYLHESEQVRLERTNRRLTIALVVSVIVEAGMVCVLLFGGF